jgi:hypothetical protein
MFPMTFSDSFSKNEKKVLDALSLAGVNQKLETDHDRSWHHFANYQLYSPEEKLSKDFVQDLLCDPAFSGKGLHPSLIGKGFMEGTLAPS